MKILLIISSLFLLIDVFLLDGHLFQNISTVLAEYSFLKWILISIFSLISSLILFKLNINYFAELAKKDKIETEFEESIEEEINEEEASPVEQPMNKISTDIGNKTLPKI